MKIYDTAHELAMLLHLLAPPLAAMMQREYRFHPTRRWRFDLAFPDHRLAVEVDGGTWLPTGGRHNRDADREKLNAAAVLGWRVLRVTPADVRDHPDMVINLITQALEQNNEQ